MGPMAGPNALHGTWPGRRRRRRAPQSRGPRGLVVPRDRSIHERPDCVGPRRDAPVAACHAMQPWPRSQIGTRSRSATARTGCPESAPDDGAVATTPAPPGRSNCPTSAKWKCHTSLTGDRDGSAAAGWAVTSARGVNRIEPDIRDDAVGPGSSETCGRNPDAGDGTPAGNHDPEVPVRIFHPPRLRCECLGALVRPPGTAPRKALPVRGSTAPTTVGSRIAARPARRSASSMMRRTGRSRCCPRRPGAPIVKESARAVPGGAWVARRVPRRQAWGIPPRGAGREEGPRDEPVRSRPGRIGRRGPRFAGVPRRPDGPYRALSIEPDRLHDAFRAAGATSARHQRPARHAPRRARRSNDARQGCISLYCVNHMSSPGRCR